MCLLSVLRPEARIDSINLTQDRQKQTNDRMHKEWGKIKIKIKEAGQHLERLKEVNG